MLFWDGTAEPATAEDVTIGHENAGIVVQVGKGTKGFKVGDKVGCLGCSYACCKLLMYQFRPNFELMGVKMNVKDARSTIFFVSKARA